VIVMTAFTSVEGAVKAMKLGADDYLSKPIDADSLLAVVERTLVQRALRREAAKLRDAAAGPDTDVRTELIGGSKPFRDLLDLARQVASAPVPVLVCGETGTGKEALARQIHAWSGRQGPFVGFKCGTLDESQPEVELFGASGHEGPLQLARGGTLLLANIDELPHSAQTRLVDLLRQGRSEDAGDAPRLDVRIIATTSCDLAGEARAGRFREDLYYRVGVVSLRVPALRERQDDILPLAQHFLKRTARQARKTVMSFSERALGVLVGFDWPGNLRQLENCVEHAVTVTRSTTIEPRDLPNEVMSRSHDQDAIPAIPGASLYELERFAILRTLEQVGGSTNKAAKILGISARKIQYRLQEYRNASPSETPSSDT
jgi:two-component system response regulator HydG